MRKGLDTMLDFGRHEHSLFGNIKNVLTAYSFNLMWCIFIVAFLRVVLNLTLVEIKGLMSMQIQGAGQMFFRAVVLAPLWEEAFYRVPLRAAIALEGKDSGNILETQILFPAILFGAISFGLAHGSVLNILIQGVSGLALSWVYLKSGYKWAVLTHAMWNFMLMFGLPILMR